MKVFISYSHGNDADHKQNVRALYRKLCEEYGVEAEYDEVIRQRETAKNFDELSLDLATKYDKVIVVLSKDYKRRADAREGGVGEEFATIFSDIKKNPRKYILVAFESVHNGIIPIGFHNRDCLNLLDAQDQQLLANKLGDIDLIKPAPVANKPKIEALNLELPKEFIAKEGFGNQPNGLAQSELRIKATELLSNDLNRKDGNFFKKYIDEVYKEREGPQESFNHFLKQSAKISFVVIGKAGKGKTTLFCNLAKKLTEIYKEDYVPLLINGAELQLNRQSLREAIESKIKGLSLTDINQYTFEGDQRLIIFIDAINEVEGDQSIFETFNNQLNELVILTKEQNLKISYAVSCRTDFWQFFQNAYWVTNELFAEGDDQEGYSYEVGDFDEGAIDDIISSYFKWFRLKGEIKYNARQQCQDPLMLRYLCEAHTERPPNDKDTPPNQIPEKHIGTYVNLRRKEVFDTFVENIRDRMFKRVKNKFGSEFKEKNKEEYTTMYLLNIARLMFENNRTVISLDEVRSVANELKHPDSDHPRHAFKTPDTIFFTFIDEGLILDQGVHSTDNQDRETYSFIFETYFEYTLGRYIALQRWHGLLKKEGEKSVMDDLDQLIQRHTDLVKGGDFTNLLGAIQYALQVVEEDKRYLDKPAFWLRLIDHLLNAHDARLLQYQMAFSTLRNSSLFSSAPRESNSEEKFYLVDKALDILWSFVEKVDDFVIGDDIKSTLVTLGEFYQQKVVAEMYDWLNNSQRSVTKKFATDVISGLASKTGKEGIALLEELADFKDFKESFWLGRTLVFTANQLGKKSLGYFQNNETELRAVWRLLLKIVNDPLQNPFTRDYAFSLLIYYTRNRQPNIQKIKELFNGEQSTIWGKWNLVYELKNLLPKLKPIDYTWVLDTLYIAKSFDNKHLDYAIYTTLQSFPQNRLPERGVELLHELKRAAWLPNGEGRIEKLQNVPSDSAVVYSPGYLEPAYENHTECRQRLQALLNKLYCIPGGKFIWLNPIMAEELDIQLVHQAGNDRHRDGRPWPTYLKEVKLGSSIFKDNKKREKQTGLSELRYESYDIARLSAGGVIRAVDFVLSEGGKNAWSLGRPPGHLANNSICVLNNIAIGAMHARKRYKNECDKIIIIDCDAHHGTHTGWTFREDPNVIYFSIHVDDSYSREEGKVTNMGEGDGLGYNFNLVYPKETDDRGYREIVDSVLTPLMDSYQPSLIMLSAGFDGHFDDELNPGNSFSEQAFIYLAQGIKSYMDKSQAKLVAAFEGGYSLEGLSNSMVHMMNVIGNWQVNPEVIGFVDQPSDLRNDQALTELRRNIEELEEKMKKIREFNPSYNL